MRCDHSGPPDGADRSAAGSAQPHAAPAQRSFEAELLARLGAEAARRGVKIDTVIAEFAAQLPADTDDALTAFIGCGASGRTEPFDIHRERRELAAKKYAEGI